VKVVVAGAFGELAAEIVFPVPAPLDLGQDLAGDQGPRLCRRLSFQFRCLLQPLVFEGVGLVEVVDFGQVGVGEDLRKNAPLRTLTRLDLAVFPPNPTAFPPVLVLPVLRIADPRLGLHVVEPDVFDAFSVGPDVLAGDRAGVAPDALVEVEHHGELGTDFHSAPSLRSGWLPPVPQSAVTSPLARSSAALSNQSISLIFRMITNWSRLAPTVP